MSRILKISLIATSLFIILSMVYISGPQWMPDYLYEPIYLDDQLKAEYRAMKAEALAKGQ